MPRTSRLVAVIVIIFVAGSVIFLSKQHNPSDPSRQILGKSEEKATTTPAMTTPAESMSTQAVSTPSSEHFQVVRVVDGDTIVVRMNGIEQTVRLIGVNTPESVDPRREVECFGIEASNKAKELLQGRSVSLTSDPTQADKDKYRRLLRYVYRDDGIFVNMWLIEQGYAYEYTYELPYEYRDVFREVQAIAQTEKRGLWGDPACSSQNIRRNIESSQKPIGFVDKDCSDFSSHGEAQAFYESQGGPANDPHKLDVDKNGVACENLP